MSPRVIPLHEYDLALGATLEMLPWRSQVAFGVATAERLFPAWEAYQDASHEDDGGLLREALDQSWAAARTGNVLDPTVGTLIEGCLAMIPDADAAIALPSHADDAIYAVAWSLTGAANLDPRAASFAARHVTDSLDAFLLKDEIPNPAQEDQYVWDHPLVRAELRRRDADLLALASPTDWTTAVDMVRRYAESTSVLPLERLVHS